MNPDKVDSVSRALASLTSRRAGLSTAIGTVAAAATVTLATASGKENGKGHAGASGKGRNGGGENRSDREGRKDRPDGTGGPGLQGPCGDGSVSDNRCSSNSDCCTNYCAGNRCRCRKRGDSCTSSQNCCNGLSCSGGVCMTGGGGGSAGPTGPTGPFGPTGAGVSPEGPTGAILFDKDGSVGETSALFYDYAASGFVGIGGSTPTGMLHVAHIGPTGPVLALQAYSGQTGPMSLWLDNDGSERFRLTGDIESNLFYGKDAGALLGNGYDNIGIGTNALNAIDTGNSNTAIGKSALASNDEGDYNTAVGKDALSANTSGSSNIAIGYEALAGNDTGDSNVAIGNQAGYANETGLENVFIGEGAGNNKESGDANVYIGYNAGSDDSYSSYNVFIGSFAGGNVIDGDQNIAIGYKAYLPLDGPNQLNIGNIIYGLSIDGTEDTISTGKIGIGTKTPTQKLDVNGNVKATNVTVPSDVRLKEGITPMSNALATVAALRPVSYAWKDTTRFGTKREYGLIAQEVAPVVPSVVHGDEATEFALDYAKLVPVLIGAIQELAERNDRLAEEVASLKQA